MIDAEKELYRAEQAIEDAIGYLEQASKVEPEAKELYYIAGALYNRVMNLRCVIGGIE
jgi:hypothetical protein